MLQEQYRLNKSSDFERVFRKGKPFYSKSIGIKVVKNHLPVSRFGVVVSTKIAKKAVKRNLLKRRLREILRLHIDRIKSGYDCMVIALPNANQLKYKELELEIEDAFKKLKILL